VTRKKRLSVIVRRSDADEKQNLRIITHASICFSLFRVLVEKTGITLTTLDWRYIRSIYILLCQSLPSDLCEPRVLHDILAATVQVSETLGQVVGDEFAQQILSVRVDVGRVLYSAAKNVFVNLEGTARVPEGCETAEHFEDEDTERPPVIVRVSERCKKIGIRNKTHQSTDLL
jgi:hypothetical protein